MYPTLKNKIISFLLVASFMVVSLMSIIQWQSFRPSFYQHFYKINDTARNLGFSPERLDEETANILSYLREDRSNLSDFFNTREKSHMEDVKDLYQAALTARRIGILVFVASLFLAIRSKRAVASQALSYLGFCVLGVLAIVIFAWIDFDHFFTLFHELFFTNDLWLLDPRVDRLIMMVQTNFFMTLIFNIVGYWSLTLGMFAAGCWFIKSKKREIHVVLFEPEIPANTGNIIRTCMASGATLHLIEPLGFILDDKHLKRSGMDYIDLSSIHRHRSLDEFFQASSGADYYFITRYGHKPPTAFSFNLSTKPIYLVFGKESTGLPLDMLARHQKKCIRIPMVAQARSLNLSNCVALIVYHVLGQLDYPACSQEEVLKGKDWLDKHIDSKS